MTRSEAASATPEPIGWYTAKVDGAGRVKLPIRYVLFLKSLNEQILFVTEHQGLVKIMTCDAWLRKMSLLDLDPDLKKRVRERYEAKGGEAEVDLNGRITLPPGLRQALQLEEKQVWMRLDDDTITVFTEEQREAELARCEATAAADEERMKELGVRF